LTTRIKLFRLCLSEVSEDNSSLGKLANRLVFAHRLSTVNTSRTL
jgi:hypothetical protein